ncbi:hypothetical protein [Gloeobacter morelensis]|uniref:Secreted protein n=1 Tax=Gloeobacter morelensis MG652769 TaxID=2781736 RepID=A0ABY3PN59_9CYAN|nr:hypothetical protein [Gloeobacter morelensis]UFP94837.1 hypothetical protein ISF26_00880 [Gloeobacter morelensis MG652769]
MLTVFSSKLWAAAAALPVLLLGTAMAQAAPWTAAGSTGVADEEDLQLVSANEGRIEVAGSVAGPATLNLRYNIVALDELVNLDNTSYTRLTARFRDNGNNARVELRLKSYNLATGVTSTLANFDSNAHPANSNYQQQGLCIPPATLDFSQNVYFIDALLTKSSSSGTPSLGAIKFGLESGCVQEG